MDFTKFVSILERKELFFCRTDQFDDPYEGTLSDFNRRERLTTYTAQFPQFTKEEYEEATDSEDIERLVPEIEMLKFVLFLMSRNKDREGNNAP
jgi:hypothetical protein